jgi:hypothetical protein
MYPFTRIQRRISYPGSGTGTDPAAEPTSVSLQVLGAGSGTGSVPVIRLVFLFWPFYPQIPVGNRFF